VSEVTGATSDGYHTFAELYDHRITLFVALCRVIDHRTGCRVWRSKLHSDGTSIDGWFVLGLDKEPGRQITYHLPMSWWSETDFAEDYACAPEFDHHSSADVLERLKAVSP
jgi:hypothetical protein